MAGVITTAKMGWVINASGHITEVAVPPGGDSGFTTRFDPYVTEKVDWGDSVITFSGTYSNDNATSNNIYFIGVSVSNEPNGTDLWFPAPAYRTLPTSSKAWTVDIPASALPPGPDKIYFTVRLVSKPGSSPGWNYWTVQRDTRTQSVYSNRSPATPNILSPAPGLSLIANTNDNAILEWDFSDPDEIGTADTPLLRDYGGWQVQVRPAPTPVTPDPAWTTPTLHLWSHYDQPDPGDPRTPNLPLAYRDRRGWNLRMDLTSDEIDYGVEQQKIKIVADPNTDPADPNINELWLAPGAWQVRVRTFDRRAADGIRIYPTDEPLTAFGNPENMPVSTYSGWSSPTTIYIVGETLPPTPVAPVYDEATYGDIEFQWQFQTPIAGRTQAQWEIYAAEMPPWGLGGTPPVGVAWAAILLGENAVTPDPDTDRFTYVNGSNLPLFEFEPGKQYVWYVGITDSAGNYQESAMQSFWYTDAPQSGPELPLPEIAVPDPGLGCGHNRVFVYRRGAKEPMGEITEIAQVTWTRVRDDISACDVNIVGWSQDCGNLLASLRSWQHELVVFRDNGSGMKRVWEGPITRLSYESDTVSIEARDVMIYVYRRILRLGYNDAYRRVGWKYGPGGVVIVKGQELGLTPVTVRARKIIQNALAYDDPNVLKYLWVLQRSDDAKQSRVVPDWSRTSWQEVDDLAAKAGLDYTTVGRRIMLWDTHNPVGTLPEMRDGDFDSPPIVTEYGMQLATVYGVSNNNGLYGFVERRSIPTDHYGHVEMLVSAWGESDENGDPETLTAEAAAALVKSLTEQAERGISQRYPTPVVVRVPDNSTLSPDLEIGINQLIPGVFIPVLADKTLRRVRQMQKLDSLKVIENSDGEQVQVTMSPAPTSANYDPDSDEGGDE